MSMPVLIALAAFQYRFWQMHQILSSTSEDELINRTKDLQEVKAFTTKYPNYGANLDKDYHLEVIYYITECNFNGKHCGVSQPNYAELPIRIDLTTGYPQKIGLNNAGYID